MLDDLKYIHERDKSDTLGIAEKQWQQYGHDFKFSWQAPEPIREVILAGMGGSALAAKVYQATSKLPVPFEVIQSYDLPARVGKNTLVICASYSGNTEETLSVFNQALDAAQSAKPMVVVISSGGELLKQAQQHSVPFMELPGGYQPRYTLGYQYRALVELFAACGLVDGEVKALEAAAEQLKNSAGAWRPDVPVKDNLAKQIALEVMGKSPVIYGGPLMAPVAYKWKISFNENAKNIAWWNQYPEFNHNEFLGWSSHPVDKPYQVINLLSDKEHPRVQKRFRLSERLLSGKWPQPIDVQTQGETVLAEQLWAVMLGDFVSLYVALLNGLNPEPVELIEKLKKVMNE